MSDKRRVAVLFSITQHMQFMRGIADCAQQNGNWQLSMNPDPVVDMPPKSLVGWNGDGVILRLHSRADLEAIRSLRIPAANVAGSVENSVVPRVMIDQEAVGRLAAEHLLKCGLQQFAYFGLRNVFYSQLRRRGFVDRLHAAGHECLVLELPHRFSKRQPWYQWNERLEQWLASLEKPVGLLAVHDPQANLVIEVCSRVGLGVPNDVAVVGVENNEVICGFAETPLTSIARDDWTIGFEGAALLGRLIEGQKPPESDILIAPNDIVMRESTDIVVVDDSYVVSATRYVRDHLDKPFGVEMLEKVTGISRRSLELRFGQCLKCTPHQYISRLRVQRAKVLLVRDKTMQLKQISRACGFPDTRRFRHVF